MRMYKEWPGLSFFLHSPDGFSLLRLIADEEGNPCDFEVVEANAAFESIKGLRSPLPVDRGCTETDTGFREGILAGLSDYAQVALNGGNLQFREYSPVLDRWYKVRVFSPEKGYVAFLYAYITEEIGQLEDYAALTASLNDIVFELDEDYVFRNVWVASEEYLFFSKSVFLNRRIDDVFDPYKAGLFMEAFHRVLLTGETRYLDYSLPIAGQERWFNAKILLRRQWEQSKLIVVISDITEKKRSEQALQRRILALTQPLEPDSRLDFEDLFNLEELQHLQDTFAESQGVASVITRPDGTPITIPSNFCRLCRDIIRQTQKGLCNCIHSDAMIGKQNTAGPIVQPCLSGGLWDAGASITVGDRHVANWLIGQVKNEELDEGRILAYADEIGADRGEFRDALAEVPSMSREKFTKVAEALYLFATELSVKAYQNVLQARLILQMKQMEEQLFREKEQLRITLMSIGDGVIATDRDGKVVLLNKAAELLTGWLQEQASGKPMKDVFHICNQITRQECESSVLLSKDGIERVVAESAAPIRNKNGEIEGAVLVFRDVTLEKRREDEVLYLSYHDGLTGLYNRRFFEEQLKNLDRDEYLPLSIIIGDVNGLKLVNDVFGHMEGDRLLCSAARIMKEACRTDDVIARWGGDEFIILLPLTPEEEAEKVCKSITLACMKEQETQMKTSLSVGVACKDCREKDILQILKSAEDLMYKHKLTESKSLRSAVVNSIRKTMHEKSHETEEHAERLKEMCMETAIHLGLSELRLYEIELLAVLHDIGKIGIRDSILNKPAPLSESEWMEMKKHPEIGFRIAQSSPELAQIAEYILTHHEKWDGSGYPSGLKGEAIPLISRILAVADAYDAMTSDRPYRLAMPVEAALAELERHAGTQFDPAIVEIFVKRVIKL